MRIESVTYIITYYTSLRNGGIEMDIQLKSADSVFPVDKHSEMVLCALF